MENTHKIADICRRLSHQLFKLETHVPHLGTTSLQSKLYFDGINAVETKFEVANLKYYQFGTIVNIKDIYLNCLKHLITTHINMNKGVVLPAFPLCV